MKTKLALFILLSLAFAKANAQEFQGIASYKSSTTVELKMDSTKMDDAVRKSIAEQLRQRMQKTYTLQFDRTASFYTENEKLARPNVKPEGAISVEVHQSKSELYKNIQKKQYVKQDELFGKTFLIQDSLIMPAWKLEKEVRSIGDYTCYKAVWTREEPSQEWEEATKSFRDTIKEKTTTVWYTPQIPISHGPEKLWGLPGLILEVQDGKTRLLCSSIVLNPDEQIKIMVPTKGKKVDQAEFDAIQQERMDEMRARSDNGRGFFITRTGG